MAQNPKTLERVHVPAKRTVKFKVGRLMREEIELGALKAASQTEVKPLSKNPAAPQA